MKYFQNWSKRKKLKAVFFVALSLPFVYLLVVFLVVNPVRGLNEKRTLNTYKTQLGQAKEEIVRAVGEPTNTSYEESCGYSSAKYEKGNLSCSVSYYIVYDAGSAKKANDIVSKISDSIGLSPLINGMDSEESPLFIDNELVNLKNDIKFIDNKRCGISYYYGMKFPQNDNAIFSLDYENKLQIQLSCSIDATYEHFTIDK